MVNHQRRTPAKPTESTFSRISRIKPYRKLFPVLEIDGANYLTWRNDMKSLAGLYDLEHTMPMAFEREPMPESHQLTKDRQLMAICLCTHVGEGLSALYRRFNNPDNIWRSLNTNFEASLNAEKAKTKREWQALSVNECRSLNEYEDFIH